MKIPAKKVVKFSAGKAFKEALNLKKGKKKQL
jgi:nucleoid DNA-binding protein